MQSLNDCKNAIIISVLKELTSHEARVIQYLYTRIGKRKDYEYAGRHCFARKFIGETSGLKLPDNEIVLQNLERLKLVTNSPRLLPDAWATMYLKTVDQIDKHIKFLVADKKHSQESVSITPLGYELAKVCNEP